jgi:hypothetical protein
LDTWLGRSRPTFKLAGCRSPENPVNYSDLRRDIVDEVAVDAYACFEKERYAIPEFLIQLFTDVVIIEFLSGFFEFSSLGQAVRVRVDRFVEDFRKSPRMVTLDIGKDVDLALSQAPVPDEAERATAQARLVHFLVNYGMSEDLARAHGTIIEQSILASLPSRP